MKRTIRLTVETHQLLVIKRTRNLTQDCCGQCSGQVPLIKLGEAAVVAGVSSQTIYAWVEAGCVHFIETAEEGLRICLDSLLNQMRI